MPCSGESNPETDLHGEGSYSEKQMPVFKLPPDREPHRDSIGRSFGPLHIPASRGRPGSFWCNWVGLPDPARHPPAPGSPGGRMREWTRSPADGLARGPTSPPGTGDARGWKSTEQDRNGGRAGPQGGTRGRV